MCIPAFSLNAQSQIQDNAVGPMFGKLRKEFVQLCQQKTICLNEFNGVTSCL